MSPLYLLERVRELGFDFFGCQQCERLVGGPSHEGAAVVLDDVSVGVRQPGQDERDVEPLARGHLDGVTDQRDVLDRVVLDVVDSDKDALLRRAAHHAQQKVQVIEGVCDVRVGR